MDGLTVLDKLFGPDPDATLNIIFHFISGGREPECLGPLSPRWQIMSVNEDSSLLAWICFCRPTARSQRFNTAAQQGRNPHSGNFREMTNAANTKYNCTTQHLTVWFREAFTVTLTLICL